MRPNGKGGGGKAQQSPVSKIKLIAVFRKIATVTLDMDWTPPNRNPSPTLI